MCPLLPNADAKGLLGERVNFFFLHSFALLFERCARKKPHSTTQEKGKRIMSQSQTRRCSVLIDGTLFDCAWVGSVVFLPRVVSGAPRHIVVFWPDGRAEPFSALAAVQGCGHVRIDVVAANPTTKQDHHGPTTFCGPACDALFEEQPKSEPEAAEKNAGRFCDCFWCARKASWPTHRITESTGSGQQLLFSAAFCGHREWKSNCVSFSTTMRFLQKERNVFKWATAPDAPPHSPVQVTAKR